MREGNPVEYIDLTIFVAIAIYINFVHAICAYATCVCVSVCVYEHLLLSESGMTCRMAVPVKLVGVE